jgi:hypothetical protein
MLQVVTKAAAERRHARRRAFERYGLELNMRTRRGIVEAIRTGRSRPVRRGSNRTTVHDVDVAGTTVRVVYDSERGELVTFLPPGRR